MASAKQEQRAFDSVETGRFVAAMAQSVTPVCVVSTDGRAGRFGVTVSAFASVSAEPPLLLVCVNRRSPAVAGIEENRCFCVNVLSEDQSAVSDCFAGRTERIAPYSFACAGWTEGHTGAPVLLGASAYFDCTIETQYDAGTHRIFIGRVVDVTSCQATPLAFSGRAYHAPRPLHLD